MPKFKTLGGKPLTDEQMESMDKGDAKNTKRENQRDKQRDKAIVKQRAKVAANREKRQAPPVPFEPRCSVCKSPHRDFIDAMLARGATSYQSIADRVPGEDGRKLDRRAVANHAKNHLGFQDDAIRRLLEAEALEIGQNYEENVRGAMTRRGALETALRKGFDDLVAGRTEVEVKDLLTIITALEKMDEQTNAAAVDQMRMQTEAFIRAIREEVDDEEIWERIANRARRIISQQGYDFEPVVDADATVVEPVNELPTAN